MADFDKERLRAQLIASRKAMFSDQELRDMDAPSHEDWADKMLANGGATVAELGAGIAVLRRAAPLLRFLCKVDESKSCSVH